MADAKWDVGVWDTSLWDTVFGTYAVPEGAYTGWIRRWRKRKKKPLLLLTDYLELKTEDN